MKKKCISLLLLIVLLTLSTGSVHQQESSPEMAVERFFQAFKALDFDLMADEIDPKEVELSLTMQNMFDTKEQNVYSAKLLEYFKNNTVKMQYVIQDAVVRGDRAIVTVDLKIVDGDPAVRSVYRQFTLKMYSAMMNNERYTEQEAAELFSEIVDEVKAEDTEDFINRTLDIQCINVEGEWYISQLDQEHLSVIGTSFSETVREIERIFGEDEGSMHKRIKYC